MSCPRLLLVVLCVAALAPAAARAGSDDAPKGRVWQIHGMRLEQDQVERLAEDMAERTLQAVESNVADLALRDAQRVNMRDVYRRVSLEVYGEVVRVVAREDLDDASKEAHVRELVLAGQKRSHVLLAAVLDEDQLRLYSAWEERQVSAFESERWEKRRRRRRR